MNWVIGLSSFFAELEYIVINDAVVPAFVIGYVNETSSRRFFHDNAISFSYPLFSIYELASVLLYKNKHHFCFSKSSSGIFLILTRLPLFCGIVPNDLIFLILFVLTFFCIEFTYVLSGTSSNLGFKCEESFIL